jgi:hypothetical protein
MLDACRHPSTLASIGFQFMQQSITGTPAGCRSWPQQVPTPATEHSHVSLRNQQLAGAVHSRLQRGQTLRTWGLILSTCTVTRPRKAGHFPTCQVAVKTAITYGGCSSSLLHAQLCHFKTGLNWRQAAPLSSSVRSPLLKCHRCTCMGLARDECGRVLSLPLSSRCSS